MTERERFLNTFLYRPVDRRPLYLYPPWRDTLERWYGEGLPRGADVNAYLGLAPVRIANISPNTGLFPGYPSRVIEETATVKVYTDWYGRTARDFKDRTTMPEWIDHAVKTPEDLRRMLDEHFLVDDLDARFPADWTDKVRAAAAGGGVVLIDGGCYYGVLRQVAGVEHASYLLYDAPELCDELFERYHTVVMEGLRRAAKLVQIDMIGFGEDIGCKNGPLVSPAMFRRLIFPRYRKVMDCARSHGVALAWCDTDGDVRELLPLFLEAGCNITGPCEVAAGMAAADLRACFGRAQRMIGGLDKREISRGRDAIDAELARNLPVLREGGFVPAIDHSVSSDISFDTYRYFIDALQKALEQGMRDN